MPFGDSITEIVCWRSKLWNKLQTTEWASVDFVGSGRNENNCRDTRYDRDNEGHSGFLAINIANQNQLDGWLRQNPADVITMHLGTNDIVQQNKAVTDIIAAFTKLVATMRTHNPRMKIVVSGRPGAICLVPWIRMFCAINLFYRCRSPKSSPSDSATTTPRSKSSTGRSSNGLRVRTRPNRQSGSSISTRDTRARPITAIASIRTIRAIPR
jgi:hypothetical protein